MASNYRLKVLRKLNDIINVLEVGEIPLNLNLSEILNYKDLVLDKARLYNKNYYTMNKDKILKSKNKLKISENSLRYYYRNKEKCCDRMRAYYNCNSEALKERARANYYANRTKILESKKNAYKSKINKSDTSITGLL